MSIHGRQLAHLSITQYRVLYISLVSPPRTQDGVLERVGRQGPRWGTRGPRRSNTEAADDITETLTIDSVDLAHHRKLLWTKFVAMYCLCPQKLHSIPSLVKHTSSIERFSDIRSRLRWVEMGDFSRVYSWSGWE